MGSLLMDGIGDTIRVSLTADPVKEVEVAWEILKALERERGPVMIACPPAAATTSAWRASRSWWTTASATTRRRSRRPDGVRSTAW